MPQKQRPSSENTQIGLFNEPTESKAESNLSQGVNHGHIPMAHRLRPQGLDEFLGFNELSARYPFLNQGHDLPSLILWGPPGSGKTTLARLLSAQSKLEMYSFNAVLGGVQDLKKIIKSAQEMGEFHQSRKFALFIDEIHRFNKAQQDALLPYVEEGALLLIGATTENPRSSINRALISRVQLVELPRLEEASLLGILDQALAKLDRTVTQDILELIGHYANGDARRALSTLELLLSQPQEKITIAQAKTLLLQNAREYDKDQDRHYDVISAFIKSLRGSDPNAALLWLAVMLDGGEDPVFIARRLVIFASEDIGNADPQALTLAVSTLQAVQLIGMPEARINLGHAICYLAATVKSNACYMAINDALSFVQDRSTIRVPDHLKSYPPKGAAPYLYPHSYPEHYVKQEYTKEKIPQFYKPTSLGVEKKIKERLESLK